MLKKIMNWFKSLFTKKQTSTVSSSNIQRTLTEVLFGRKVTVELGDMIRKTGVGHHAWYNSNVGIIKKPIQ